MPNAGGRRPVPDRLARSAGRGTGWGEWPPATRRLSKRGPGVARLRLPQSASLRDEAEFAGLDLKRQHLGEDAALGQSAGEEPHARLASGPRHAVKLALLVEAPARADRSDERRVGKECDSPCSTRL